MALWETAFQGIMLDCVVGLFLFLGFKLFCCSFGGFGVMSLYRSLREDYLILLILAVVVLITQDNMGIFSIENIGNYMKLCADEHFVDR